METERLLVKYITKTLSHYVLGLWRDTAVDLDNPRLGCLGDVAAVMESVDVSQISFGATCFLSSWSLTNLSGLFLSCIYIMGSGAVWRATEKCTKWHGYYKVF